MISKRILISTIVLISLVQFITCPTPNETKDPAATKTEVKARAPAKPKSSASKSATTATEPMEPGMNPDEDTAVKSQKPTSLRKKLFKPVKSVFWPIRFIWRKFKTLKSKIQNIIKKAPATPAASESNEYNVNINDSTF